MAREDLVAALKNAVDRKQPIDSAKISLVTAGYSIDDVEEAAREVGVHPELSQRAPSSPSSMPSPSQILSMAPSPGKEKPKVKKGMNWLIPVLIAVMILLIGTVLYTYVLKKPGI